MEVLKHHPDILPDEIDVCFRMLNRHLIDKDFSFINAFKTIDTSEHRAFPDPEGPMITTTSPFEYVG